MTSKLGLYNAALMEIGERRLASLTENRPPRHSLDEVWDDAFQFILEQGLWNCAMRSQELAYDPGVTPVFGYTYAFAKPADLVRLAALCSDANLTSTVENFADEAGYWYANYDALYVSFVSDDASYGGDMSLWPATLTRYASLELATRIVVRDTASESKLERLEKQKKRALIDARSKDAMSGPNRYAMKNNWARARNSGSSLRGTGRGL